MPNNLEHKFKSLLDSCVGNTVELKKELSAHLSMSKRYIDLLYSGKQSTIPAHRALEILNFLNSKRMPDSPELEMTDLITERKCVSEYSNNTISKLNQ